MFSTLFRRKRILSVLSTLPFFIIRQFCLPIYKRSRFQGSMSRFCVVIHCPKDTPVNQFLKISILPGAFIMTISGIKNTPFTILPSPGIRFRFNPGFIFKLIGFNFPFRQDIIIVLKVVMQIGFIDNLKWTEAFHDKMIGLNNFCLNGIHGMSPELPTHHFNIFG